MHYVWLGTLRHGVLLLIATRGMILMFFEEMHTPTQLGYFPLMSDQQL